MATFAGRYDENLLQIAGSGRNVVALVGATVEVFESDGTTNATLYDDRDKTAYTGTGSIVEPDASGNLQFFADPGIYVLEITVDGTVARTDTVNVSIDGVEAASMGTLVLSEDKTVTGAWDFTGGISEGGTPLSGTYLSTDLLFDVTHDDYGAVADGVTDDATAIQAAIDAAKAAGGGKVVLARGDSYCGSSLTWPATVSIDGRGSAATAANAASVLTFAAGTSGIIQDASDGEFAGLSNVFVRSQGAGASGTDDGVRIRSGRARLDRVVADGFGQDGINIDTSSAGNANLATLVNCRARGNARDGFHIEGSNSNVIRLVGPDSVSNGRHGYFNDSAQCVYIGPHASGNTTHDYYDDGSSNAYFMPYIETTGTVLFDTTSRACVWMAGNYANGTLTDSGTRNVILDDSMWKTFWTDQALRLWPDGSTASNAYYDIAVTTGRRIAFTPAESSGQKHVTFAAGGGGGDLLVNIEGEAHIDGKFNHDGSEVGFYGVVPVAKAADPGTATGTDATVINNIVAALRNLGLVT